MNWILAVSLSLSACAAQASPQEVATVALADFSVGHAWTWEYRDQNQSLYSTERYTVVSNDGKSVLIEMSTKFPADSGFRVHHRLLVPVEKCLAAYANRVQVQPWSYRMFFLDGEKWQEFAPPSTLAFEEKFNCNPYRHDSYDFKTEFKMSDVGELFQHLRWRRLPGSWFMNEGSDKGVAFEKGFEHTGGVEVYTMKFVKTQP